MAAAGAPAKNVFQGPWHVPLSRIGASGCWGGATTTSSGWRLAAEGGLVSRSSGLGCGLLLPMTRV